MFKTPSGPLLIVALTFHKPFCFHTGRLLGALGFSLSLHTTYRISSIVGGTSLGQVLFGPPEFE